MYAFATHGLFSSEAIKRIEGSDLKKLIVTNTTPLREVNPNGKITQVSAGIYLINYFYSCDFCRGNKKNFTKRIPINNAQLKYANNFILH